MAADPIASMRQKQAAPLLAEWLPKLGLKPGHALDLGCGVGAEAEYLAKAGFLVDAIDKSPAMANAARQRCTGLPVNVIEGDFLDFNFKPDHYQLVAAINSLPFVRKDQARTLLRYVQASLATGGAAVLAVYGPEHAWSDRADMSFWTAVEFREMWDGFILHHFEEYKGPWPLMTGEEIFQHRIHVVAQKT